MPAINGTSGLMFKVRGNQTFRVEPTEDHADSIGRMSSVVHGLVYYSAEGNADARKVLQPLAQYSKGGEYLVDTLARILLGIQETISKPALDSLGSLGDPIVDNAMTWAKRHVRNGLIHLTGIEGVIVMLLNKKIEDSLLPADALYHDEYKLHKNKQLLPLELDIIHAALKRLEDGSAPEYLMAISAKNGDPRALEALKQQAGYDFWSAVVPYIGREYLPEGEEQPKLSDFSLGAFVFVFNSRKFNKAYQETLWPFIDPNHKAELEKHLKFEQF